MKNLSSTLKLKNINEGYSVSLPDTPSRTMLRAYLGPNWDAVPQEEASEQHQESASFQTVDEFSLAFAQYILRNSVAVLTGQLPEASPTDVNFSRVSRVFIFEIADSQPFMEALQQNFPLLGDDTVDKKSEISTKSEKDYTESRASWCVSHKTYDIGNRHEFERFKKFIRGTLGERYWWLWIDIERLKVLKDPKRQKRQLDKMKKIYLMSNGDFFLTLEVLQKLHLMDGDQWNMENLRHIQPEVVKPLLLYWGPRFCVTHTAAIQTTSTNLKIWHSRQQKPRMDVDPFPQMVSLLPLRAKSCMPKIAHPASQVWLIYMVLEQSCHEVKGKMSPDVSELGSSKMERMLQSLNTENRAGYIFTQFCEMSGNELWKNSTHFWLDLQDYHQLFYQETLHPFKLCKQAQFLYANYIAPSAAMNIGLQQSAKNEIYNKIDPPFEDLFDPAEEYILTLLLVPWMKMIEQDRDTLGKVGLVEETRQLDSVYFRKLQAMHEERISKKSEVRGAPINKNKLFIFAYITDLLNDRLNLEQFRLFLERQSASTDLMCWMDIEQFRRMLHKNKDQRQEKSKDIKNKYLNKKYFFGPDSPATKEEQEQIMKLGGGWGQLLHEQVLPVILLEIQKYIQMRLEKKWLPLFFASEEPGPLKKPKPHLQDAAEDILIQRHEKKTEPWKHVDNKWVSSSKEIITFRKALLNPITALQFQRFVSLKGDLLGNGVIFWQEVQKYKDMCHSHCEDAIIQNKITMIINCFINSAIPPAIQIDIPEEQAQKIIEHRRELGPYVFREAQMTVFALLFKFWPKFCEFRGNLADEKIMPLLEKRKERRLLKLKRAREAEEKVRRAKLSAGTISDLYAITTSFVYLNSELALQMSWTYSKYIEALQQERVLLKIQDDLDKKSIASSAYTGQILIRFCGRMSVL
uniref:Regulator of G protein signaling 22 n=1 Tax=Varanus komodoensis TaxID=61221 RepID=A0A8D2L3N3_VARKO